MDQVVKQERAKVLYKLTLILSAFSSVLILSLHTLKWVIHDEWALFMTVPLLLLGYVFFCGSLLFSGLYFIFSRYHSTWLLRALPLIVGLLALAIVQVTPYAPHN
ncbi:hypothetical protein [Paenibacillus sp. YPG26]|uniref:hypothetical protein n=1 Tax=Paenibacillus sp. YPG26 TaxID=2878915 RepID=UPI002040EAA8|nr:hypothetical protein [Paenibacillus sp. YPG26]USB33412.1 hypothetical protein LDO05_00775 [Paenibacillus sp. YPG26]